MVELIRLKAERIFKSGQLMCAPAVLSQINETLGGGMDPGLVRRLTSGLVEGLGGAGCLCGSLAGAEMAVGLFLGGELGVRTPPWSKPMHDRFKACMGATCCRVIGKKAGNDPKARFKLCVQCTGEAAEIAADIILKARPELAQSHDLSQGPPRYWRLKGHLKRLLAAMLS